MSPKRLVGEAELGVEWRVGQLAVSAAFVRTGNEIAALPERIGAQDFVRVQVMLLP